MIRGLKMDIINKKWAFVFVTVVFIAVEVTMNLVDAGNLLQKSMV